MATFHSSKFSYLFLISLSQSIFLSKLPAVFLSDSWYGAGKSEPEACFLFEPAHKSGLLRKIQFLPDLRISSCPRTPSAG